MSGECKCMADNTEMDTEEPRYAVKFMVTVDEEQAEEAAGLLRQSIAPDLKDWGFRQVLILSRRLQMTESRVLRRLLEDAPAESSYAQHMRDLHETLVMGGPKSYPHSMLHHRNKERYPEEHRHIKDALENEDNWVEVPARKFDCFAIYDTDVDMKADTLGRRDLPEGRPHSGDLVAGRLTDLMVSPLRGTHHTVVHCPPPIEEDLQSARAVQTQVAAFLHPREARDWTRDRLLPALAGQRGYLGALVLRSRNMGFVAGKGTVPRGLGEHRGESPEPARRPARLPSVPCEGVTLWQTEADAGAGVDRIAGSLPWAVGGDMAGDFIQEIFHTEHGELILRI